MLFSSVRRKFGLSVTVKIKDGIDMQLSCTTVYLNFIKSNFFTGINSEYFYVKIKWFEIAILFCFIY